MSAARGNQTKRSACAFGPDHHRPFPRWPDHPRRPDALHDRRAPSRQHWPSSELALRQRRRPRARQDRLLIVHCAPSPPDAVAQSEVDRSALWVLSPNAASRRCPGLALCSFARCRSRHGARADFRPHLASPHRCPQPCVAAGDGPGSTLLTTINALSTRSTSAFDGLEALPPPRQARQRRPGRTGRDQAAGRRRSIAGRARPTSPTMASIRAPVPSAPAPCWRTRTCSDARHVRQHAPTIGARSTHCWSPIRPCRPTRPASCS